MNWRNIFNRSAITALAMTLLPVSIFSGPASAENFEFPIMGGPGGDFFRVFCPPNTFMVGLEGRAGDIIDNMVVQCANIGIIPSIRPRKDWRVDHSLFFAAAPRMGQSGGGAPKKLMCSGENLVHGIRFNTEFFDGNHLIAFVNMSCIHGTLAGTDDLRFGFNFPAGEQVQLCPPGMWAIGIKGRMGFFVQAIGLLCATMPSRSL